jgi:hypothetical protein
MCYVKFILKTATNLIKKNKTTNYFLKINVINFYLFCKSNVMSWLLNTNIMII